MKTKTPKRDYSKQCDKLFGEIVRAPGRCFICGSTEVVQCAHGFSRTHRNTRWDLRNAWPLCKAHHFYYTMRPKEWDDWLHKTWGDELYDEMNKLRLSTTTVNTKAMLAVLQGVRS